jgi:hypothetical protein
MHHRDAGGNAAQQSDQKDATLWVCIGSAAGTQGRAGGASRSLRA